MSLAIYHSFIKFHVKRGTTELMDAFLALVLPGVVVDPFLVVCQIIVLQLRVPLGVPGGVLVEYPFTEGTAFDLVRQNAVLIRKVFSYCSLSSAVS